MPQPHARQAHRHDEHDDDGPDEDAAAHVRAAEGDLRAAGRLTGSLDFAAGDEVGARDVELVPVAKPTA